MAQNNSVVIPEITVNLEYIQELARKNGIENTNQLSHAAGITTAGTYNIMNGKRAPSIQSIVKILIGVGLSLDEIREAIGPVYIFEAPPES